jgi:hypothetical protein
MFGPAGAGSSDDDAGLVPRLANELFARLVEYEREHSWIGIVEATYTQVYKEHVFDLLDDDAPQRRGEDDPLGPTGHEPKVIRGSAAGRSGMEAHMSCVARPFRFILLRMAL